MDITFACRVPRDFLRYGTQERVALLVGERTSDTLTVRTIVPCANMHRTPQTHFSIDVDQAKVMVGDLSMIVGVLHSHDHEPQPSEDDIAGIPPGWIGGVVCYRRITSWYDSNGVLKDYTVWWKMSLEESYVA